MSAVAALALAACGGGGDSEGGGAAATSQARKADKAFLSGTVPHHENAVEMAKLALEKGERKEIKQLAEDIVSAQESEIAQMKRAHQRIFGSALDPKRDDPADLGLSRKEAGMEMETGMTMLEKAKEFDREFIDMMIGHHRAAIRMARAELARGGDAEVKKLARSVVAAQSKEIDDMNRWRMDWYGRMSPSGGVPGDSGGGDMEGMEGM